MDWYLICNFLISTLGNDLRLLNDSKVDCLLPLLVWGGVGDLDCRLRELLLIYDHGREVDSSSVLSLLNDAWRALWRAHELTSL